MSVEKNLETQLREKVKKLGGLALKISSPYFTGLPDRQVILPNGRSYWVELKSAGKKPTSRQAEVHKQLEDLGFEVWVISTPSTLISFLNHIQKLKA